MSKKDCTKCSIFLKITFLIVFIHFCTSAPVSVPENAYTQFITELNRNNCSVPIEVQLPFDTSKANNFEYLSSYLGICQKTESTKRNKESVVLCQEIFGNIRNISCPAKTALPEMSVDLSQDVCKDIGTLKGFIPEADKSLLKRLTDGLLCEIMCENEFEKACQVLLWSFKVRELIASLAQVPEQSNDPEDGDNFKQDNTVDENNLSQTIVNVENEKKNAEETKIEIEDAGHYGMTDLPQPLNLKDNPEQNSNVGSKKPLSNIKEKLSADQTIPNSVGQDLTGVTKPTNNIKTSITLSEQTPLASKSNTKAKPMGEIAKSASDSENVNDANVPVTKHGEGNDGAGLSQSVNTVTYDQSQDVNANTLADGDVQDKKDANILAVGHLTDNSKIADNPNISINTNVNSPHTKIPDQTKGDPSTNFLITNELPHESGNAKSPKDLPNNEQNLAQNKPPITVINEDDKLAQNTDASTTGGQAIKDLTQQQNTLEAVQDKTSFARDDTKADQPQTNSGLSKSETVDSPKTDITISDDAVTDQKKTIVTQQAGELDNAIPDTPITADEKLSEKIQKSKATDTVPSSLAETSTKTTVALEKMEGDSDLRQPVGEEADHYGDLENTEDDEYSRPDYDGGLYEVSKNKESIPEVANPITVAKEKIDFPPRRNGFGQDSSDIQMIAAFPEQEDSHFFFYFLSIVLILMAGYLVFHNKQKIIALIVEGRHERNRRSHRVGYKKLETK